MVVKPTELVAELDRRGAVIAPDGVRTPRRAWTPELRQSMSQNRDVLRLLYRLRMGQRWLTKQHERWDAGDEGAASDDLFCRALDTWNRLDADLRVTHEYHGCIHGPGRVCPAESPANCRGCERPA